MTTFKEIVNLPEYNDPENLKNAEIRSVRFFRDKNLARISMHTPGILSFADFSLLKEKLSHLVDCRVFLEISADNEKISQNDLYNYLEFFKSGHPEISALFGGTMNYDEEAHTLTFSFDQDEEAEFASVYLEELQQYLCSIGLDHLQARCDKRIHQEKPEEVITLDFLPEKPKNEEKPVKKKYYKVKHDEYAVISLKDVNDAVREIQFTGDVFASEGFEVKNTHRLIQSVSVFDGEDAIIVKIFEGRNFSREEIESIKVGDRIQVFGSISFDNFAKDLVCEAEEIRKVEKEKITDPAPVKRVELHMHTNMSEMDGVCDAESIISYVHGLGHEGIVITDHADVQSFVKAFNQASKLKKKKPEQKFKIGLGCEVNLADEHLKIVTNPTDQTFDSVEYIAFDLETTGLSCYYDHVIEFGAVKIRNRSVVDRIQMFVKPPVSIPGYITRKTNISNEMVKDARSFAEVSETIRSWLGDAVLVAHNAEFDIHFLNEEFRRLGQPPLTNTYIDTLDMSRAILKERRAYRLGNISRYYRIAYDEEVAHRADYDAEALSGVFLALLRDAENAGARTLHDLQYKIQDEEAFKKVRHSHTVLIARNLQGLKDLYRLVSMSNTKTLAVMGKNKTKEDAEVTAEPRVLRSAVDAVRKNLYIGTSCQNNEVFELACNGDDERLYKALSWYDYVELQPLSCYTNMIALGSVPNKERIMTVQKRLITAAKELGIPVVADSDAHYCTPEQKIFRDVYIMNQGVGGMTHPLYIRDENLRMRTKNPDQHIRLTQEMKDEFAWLDDPELVEQIVIENPRRIFESLEEIRPVPDGTYPPHIEGSDRLLKEVCFDTARRVYEFEGKIPEQVTSRLNRELDAIIGAGYYVNYYISHLLVKKSNEDGYVVGSRGSVGSSFVATMSGITEVNPLSPHYICPECHYSEWIEDPEVKSGFDLPDKVCPHCGAVMKGNGHNIPFETFLGFHGDKVPDIDLNFSNEYQARAHAFTKEVFGEDHVFRAGTIGTVAEKTAFGYVSGYCEKMNITNMRRPMREYLASGCQNVKRTTGQHPGGIIVIPNNFEAEDFTPVQYPANDPSAEWKTTHYDFHDIHDNVLKFDILGHVDPTAMRLLTNISKTDPLTIPMNDPEVLSLFSSDQALKADPRVYKKETGALGLPEFGTRITRRVLEETRPKIFSELVILSGLTHGTDVWAGNAQVLVQQGHPLEEVIGCRDDIMTYLLNKKLEPIHSFKIMEDVRKGRGLTPEYEKIMREHDVPDWYIDSCKKIKYMFPKAHAVAYVIMAVRIAWYKVYEPHNFYIQFLSLRCDAYEIETMTKGLEPVRARMQDIQTRMAERNSANPVSNKERALLDTLEVCEELYARGYRIGNVDLYKSKATEFCVVEGDEHTLIPPFVVIDNLGANVARSIEEARKKGEFLSKEDILRRTQLSATLLKKLEVLGCLNGIDESNQMSLF